MRVLALLVGSLVLSACGEQDPDLEIPPRAEGQMVLDQVGVLDDDRVAAALDAIEGWDVVAVTYETSQANAGEAHRAGEAVIAAWDVDVVLVAVARPGEFTSTDESRRRFFGATPADVREVPAGVREALADEVVPAFSVDNDWTGAFEAAAQRLAEER